MVNDYKIEELVSELIKFKTCQKNPEEIKRCLDFCKDFFSEEVVDGKVFIKEYKKNGVPSIVIANNPDKHLDVLLLGHIDTVDGPDELFEPKIVDGKLFGRGSMDMKAFVATSMVVLKKVLNQDISNDLSIGVIIVSDEELGGEYGAKYLVEEIGYSAKVVLVPDDGEKINQVVSHSKSIMNVEFFAKGREAHGCTPWEGENAIEKNIITYKNLKKKFPDTDGLKGEQWINTINLGILSGGTASNEVPGESRMVINIRWTDKTSKEDIINIINKSVVSGVNYKISFEAKGIELDKENNFSKLYFDSIKTITGKDVEFLKSGGGTDGRYFSYAGMNVITHQGSGGDCQGENEFVDIDSLYKLVDIQIDFFKKIAKNTL